MKARRLCNGTNVVVFDAPPSRNGPPTGVVLGLPAGGIVHSKPQFTPSGTVDPQQAQTALSLGYGDDVLAMVRDHDPLHALLCDWLGLPTSYGLEVAAGIRDADELSELEEAAVLAVTVFMRKAGGKLPL